ncbi:gamma-interferon-inducible lysosomal thiol reductase-like [Sitophilus oryzae]|uniref:Gamma-interferon-inducible lysosomal thiol reductase-like n=1 Tax=Sitophilus oryzae TaxID=7048 RepID=A0A6J2YWK7_SITOR|nr:gamma-interferon-inducible lysosomal thiol reductase-like [Sitophilus oryzae]
MFKLVATIFMCLYVSSSGAVEKVNFTLIYETRCPYSVEFIFDQLYPGYQKIGEYLNVTLLPYARENEADGGITCQHGDNECYISRAQVCSLKDSAITQELQVEFLHCSEQGVYDSRNVTDADIQQCLTSVLPNISWDTVKTCIEGEESTNLLKDIYDIAVAYGRTYVPYLIFNEQHDQDLENKARGDFVAAVCSLLTSPPAVCQSN